MASLICFARIAVPIAEKSGHGVRRAWQKLLSQHVNAGSRGYHTQRASPGAFYLLTGAPDAKGK